MGCGKRKEGCDEVCLWGFNDEELKNRSLSPSSGIPPKIYVKALGTEVDILAKKMVFR